MKKRGMGVIYCLMLILLLVSSVPLYAHEDELESTPQVVSYSDPAHLHTVTLKILGIASIIALAFVVVAIRYEKQMKKSKKVVFIAIALPLLLASLFLVGTTIYTNIVSMTGGPVHWHADYEVWACDKKLDLIDPKGLSNRIGTATLHEHNDDRIHVEGVVQDLQDVSLGGYFETIGGELSPNHLTYPTNEGELTYRTGDLCPDNKPGILKVFVNGKKKEDYSHYVLTHVAYVPPGDCIIIDFSPEDAETTNKICASWRAKEWTYK